MAQEAARQGAHRRRSSVPSSAWRPPGTAVGVAVTPMARPPGARGRAHRRGRATPTGRPRRRAARGRSARSGLPGRGPDRARADRRRRPAGGRRDRPRDAPLTVVFVHGYTLSMASWTFQRRTLAAELATANGHRPDARLVFYDQRGHGASGRGHAEHSTIEQLARDLARGPGGPGAARTGRARRALDGRHDDHGAGGARPELFGSRIVARRADLHLQRQPRRPELRAARPAHPRARGGPPGGRLDDAPPAGVSPSAPGGWPRTSCRPRPARCRSPRPTSTRRSSTTSTR